MIEPATGDLFVAGTQAIVNAVNCYGVMGAGLALQFKRRFPAYFTDYKAACADGGIAPGRVGVYRREAAPHFIISFPTKRHWREPSQLDDIRTGLVSLVDAIRTYEIESIAIPALGCGLGSLDWSEVRPLITAALEPLNCQALLFEPR